MKSNLVLFLSFLHQVLENTTSFITDTDSTGYLKELGNLCNQFKFENKLTSLFLPIFKKKKSLHLVQSKNQVHLSTVLSFKNLTGDEQSLSQTYSYDKFFISRVIFYPREIQRNFHFESFNILQHSDIVILIKILKCR